MEILLLFNLLGKTILENSIGALTHHIKKKEVVRGLSDTKILGDNISLIKGNESKIVTGGGLNQYFDGLNTVIKGEARHVVEGAMTMASSTVLTMTAQNEVIMTSPEANIAADNLSVFGSTGTIGGDNIIAHVKNIFGTSGTFTAGVTAPAFHGALEGNAKTATEAARAGSAESLGDGGSGGTEDDTATDTTTTSQPTAALLAEYRKGSKGVKEITIDPGDITFNNVDLSLKTGGVADIALEDTREVRRKLRDPAHRNNAEFVALMLSLIHI